MIEPHLIQSRIVYLLKFAQSTKGYGYHTKEINSIIKWCGTITSMIDARYLEVSWNQDIQDILREANAHYAKLCDIRHEQRQEIPPLPISERDWSSWNQ